MSLETFFYVFMSLVVAGLGAIVYKAVTASGETTYCYVERTYSRDEPVHAVKGAVDWRPDRDIAQFKDFNEAVKISTMQCPKR